MLIAPASIPAAILPSDASHIQADLNNDGWLDSVFLYQGRVEVTFACKSSCSRTTLTLPALHIVVFDADHDGDMDLLALENEAEFSVYFNDGRGHFEKSGHRFWVYPRVDDGEQYLNSCPNFASLQLFQYCLTTPSQELVPIIPPSNCATLFSFFRLFSRPPPILN